MDESYLYKTVEVLIGLNVRIWERRVGFAKRIRTEQVRDVKS